MGLFAIAFLLSLFAGRLLQLQGVDASAYATVADSERRLTTTVSASRGMITDRDGVPLAQTVDSVNVFADQTLVENPALTARMLAPFLDVDVVTLERQLTGERRFAYLAKDVDLDTWTDIGDLDLDGVQAEPTHRRVYPGGELAANVLGFIDAAGVGQRGIEAEFDDLLTGEDGTISYLRDGSGRRIPSGTTSQTEVIPGQDVRLTIDRDLQWVAQQAIAAKVKETGAVSGTVVVMTPGGKLLALATAPTFDPNHASTADQELVGNRPLDQVYEPGSVQKALTLSAVIEEGLATPTTVYTVPDRIVIDGEDYGDHSPHAEGRWTLANIMAESSNVGTVLAADPLPEQTLYDYERAFGLGEPTGLGLPGESPGYVMPPDQWYPSTRHTMAFGQGLSVNAVQVASMYATIANGGVRVAPSIVEGTTAEDGTLVPAPAPEERRVISESTATQVTEMLEMVVSEGTGRVTAPIDGYRVAGKTGTAQFSNPACGGCYSGFTASFVGFAPADAPELIVSVTLQQPVNGHYGGTLAGPVFQDVMSYGLQALEVPPTGAVPPDLPLTEEELTAGG